MLYFSTNPHQSTLQLYWKQSIDLQSKPMTCFLYKRNSRLTWLIWVSSPLIWKANQWHGFYINVSLDWHGLIWVNYFSASFTKCSNTLKQFVGHLPTNCLSVFDHLLGLALKGLRHVVAFWIIENFRTMPCPLLSYCNSSSRSS